MGETQSSMEETPRAFCYRCFKAESVCICGSVSQVSNRTHVHIIQHPRERRCAIGTVRLARLGLARCSVEINRPWSGEPSRLATEPPPGAAVLYPSDRARPVEELSPADRPTTLIVLDGTWHQARTLYKNNPWLDALPHLVLAQPKPSNYRIRAEPKHHYLSTFEAIVATLRHLEPDTAGLGGLLGAFDGMIDTQIERAQARQIRRASPSAPREAAPLSLGDVLVHVETVGPAAARRIVQLCALRIETGERFEALVAPDGERAGRKVAHMGLTPADFQGAVTEPELRARWQAFMRPGEVLCAWSPRTLDAVDAPQDAACIKAAWCNSDQGSSGSMADIVADLGLACPSVGFAGRAATLMSQTLALRMSLLQAEIR